MPIHNEIFDTYRIQQRVKEQLKAIKLLIAQGYTVFDLEGNIINKDNINDLREPRWNDRRLFKKKQL